MSPDNEFCQVCRFSFQKDEHFECRRHAPRPVQDPGAKHDDQRTGLAFWPVVFEEDWCGEFQRDPVRGEDA